MLAAILKNKRLSILALSILPILLVSCQHAQTDRSNSEVSSAACAGNAYLAKYGCSIERIQQAAEEGSPDAQYALGYMYYYGISTVRDPETAELWIKRAADQGQPLAKRALGLIRSGNHFNDLHHAAQGQSGGRTPSAASSSRAARAGRAVVPKESVSSHLPGHNPSSTPVHHITPSPAPVDAAPTPANPPVVSDPRLTHNAKPIVANQLATASTKGYTIQLMGSHDLKSINHFISAYNVQKQAHYYRTKLNGKPWYLLTFGNYETAQQAHNALSKLPKAMKQSQPWVKSMASIHREVKRQKVVG